MSTIALIIFQQKKVFTHMRFPCAILGSKYASSLLHRVIVSISRVLITHVIAGAILESNHIFEK